MNIHIYVGHNGKLTIGNGKTLVMVIDSYYYYNRGYKIISNFELNFAHENFDIGDLIKILKTKRKCVLLIDEIAVFASAYNYNNKKTRELFKLVRQVRKKDIILKMTAQTYNDIPRYIRRLGNKIFVIYKIHTDLSPCDEPDNRKCGKEHLYMKKTILSGYNETKILTPHLILKNKNKIRIKKDFFYNQYKSEEIII